MIKGSLMAKVVVTGAGGHVGYNLLQLLISRGYSVRAMVRQPSHPSVDIIRKLPVEIVKGDILEPRALEAAFQGCDGLFHLAAVYKLVAANPADEIIKPACDGVRNVMLAAHQCGIKKVVMTSSIAAVGSVTSPDQSLDEKSYNTGAVDPYFYAKTQSELIAWDLAEKYAIKLLTVLPGAILGPGFFKHTPSTLIVDQILYNKAPLALPGKQNYVDVRDVAAAHLLVYEHPDAHGRFLATGQSTSMQELAHEIKMIRPRIWGPLLEMPLFLCKIAPVLDAVRAFLYGDDRSITQKAILEFAGKYQMFDNQKLRGLGWQPQPFAVTVADTVKWIEDGEYLFS